MLDASQFKTTDPLADMSIKFTNELDQFVAMQIFTPHYVPKAQFKFYQYDRSNWRKVETRTSSKAEANKIDYGVFTTSATAILRKLAGEVDPADERDADVPVADMRLDTAQQVMEQLYIGYEADVYAKINTTGNYEASLTSALAAGSRWSDNGGDPVNDARNARTQVKLACGKVPNTLVLSWTAMEYLRIHPALIDRVKYTSKESLDDATIANLLGIKRILIASATYNTGAEGASDSLSEIWGSSALFAYIDPSTKLRTMTFGRSFIVQDFYTRTYQDQKKGAKDPLEYVESGFWVTPEFVALQDSSNAKSCAGYLLQTVF